MKLIIGIDPDLDKSGVAIWASDKTFVLACLNLPELVELFTANKNVIEKVVIEAGWLIKKSNFHARQNQSVFSRESAARNVGENHATGKHIECFARAIGLNVQLLKPQGKKTHEEFVRITSYEGRTNPEKRDAGMLVYGMPFKTLGV